MRLQIILEPSDEETLKRFKEYRNRQDMFT